MKTFKQYIEESQWMYHGTNKEFDTLEPNRDHYMIDRAIGSHFASDKTLSDKFTKGLYGNEEGTPVTIKTQTPPRSKIEKVPQRTYYKIQGKPIKQTDQNAIEYHVGHTVFSHPEGKELFKEWIKQHPNNHMGLMNNEKAEDMYNKLSSGQHVNDPKFGHFASKANTFRSYLSKDGAFGSSMGSKPELKRKIVDKFLDIMKEKGVKGLSYINTSPNETQGIRSPKSYILFHPSEHEHQYFRE